MSTLNAVTQALLRANRNFLTNMTPTVAAVSGVPLLSSIIRQDVKAKSTEPRRLAEPHRFNCQPGDRTVLCDVIFHNLVVEQVRMGQDYKKACLVSLYRVLPEAKAILMSAGRTAVRRLRNR